MGWAEFYLICFLVGFILTVISLTMGALDLHLWDGHGHVHLGSGDVPSHDLPFSHGGLDAHAAHHLSPFNFATLMAFLAWFGGTGYLLTRYTAFWSLLALVVAAGAGFAGASLVFLYLVKVFVKHDHTMNPADYRIEGQLGTVTVGIREGGTGEIVFSLAGTRQTCGARCASGAAIPRGTEVIVERYEKGIAYVCPWDEVAEDSSAAGSSP